MRYYVMLRNV